MRKLIVTNIVSLDGYIAGPGDNVMALPMDPTFDAHNVERMRAADTVLLGRRSYEGFKSYWPSVADDETASADNRDISRLWRTLEKVVVSDTLTPGDTDPWPDTRIVRRVDAHEQIAALKQGEGRDILMFASHVLWNDLLRAGLVDELHLMIGATVLGGGTPAFEPATTARLRLLGVRTASESDNVIVRYAPV